LKHQFFIALFSLLLFSNCSDTAVNDKIDDENIATSSDVIIPISSGKTFCDCSEELLPRVQEIIAANEDSIQLTKLNSQLAMYLASSGCDIRFEEAQEEIGKLVDKIDYEVETFEESMQQIYIDFDCAAFQEYNEATALMVSLQKKKERLERAKKIREEHLKPQKD